MEHEEQGKNYTWSENLEMEQDKTIYTWSENLRWSMRSKVNTTRGVRI